MGVLIEVLGWVGTIALLFSFWLLTLKRVTSDGYKYHALNAAGAFLLAVTTAQSQAWSAVALNSTWCLIACTGLLKAWKNRTVQDTGEAGETPATGARK